MKNKLQELINEWKSEAVQLLLKSKTTTDDIKEAGYYAASMRLTMCYTEAELLLNDVKINPSASTSETATVSGNEQTKEDWYCPECEEYLSPEQVTNDGKHWKCGTDLEGHTIPDR